MYELLRLTLLFTDKCKIAANDLLYAVYRTLIANCINGFEFATQQKSFSKNHDLTKDVYPAHAFH